MRHGAPYPQPPVTPENWTHRSTRKLLEGRCLWPAMETSAIPRECVLATVDKRVPTSVTDTAEVEQGEKKFRGKRHRVVA